MDENYFKKGSKVILFFRALINKVIWMWKTVKNSLWIKKCIKQLANLQLKQIISQLTRHWNLGISAPAGKILSNRNLKSLAYKKNEGLLRIDVQNTDLPSVSVSSEYSYLQERKALSLKKNVTREYRNNSK